MMDPKFQAISTQVINRVNRQRNQRIRRVAAIKCMAARLLHEMELEQHLATPERGYLVRTGKRVRDRRRK